MFSLDIWNYTFIFFIYRFKTDIVHFIVADWNIHNFVVSETNMDKKS